MKTSETALPSAFRTLPESLRTPVVLSDPDGIDAAIASRVRRDWRAACAGLRSIVEFGALLIEVETWLKKRGGMLCRQGTGLKAWLAENAPEVDYKTAMGYKYAASGLMALADKALYNVKKNGKHGYILYSDAANADDDISGLMDIDTISEILGERSIPNVALQLDKDVFAYVYRCVMRYNLRNSRTACKILFTINENPEIDDAYYNEMCDEFGNHIKDSLRKSDIFMRGRNNQYFVFLTEVREDSYNMVADNLINKWYEEKGNKLKITYEASLVSMGERPVSR